MPTSKKAPVKKKPAAKRPVAKSAVKKPAPMRSFRVAPEPYPFFTRRLTKQTVFWLILLVVIVIFQILILIAQLGVIQATTGYN